MTPQNRPFRVHRVFGVAMTIGFALFVVFGVYAYFEKRIDRANDLRQTSDRLADQLRQSSDELTRMARTYVVTGKPIFKQYYQDILDIRDGRKPRPQEYLLAYWDQIVANPQVAQPEGGQAIALLELMRQSGVTGEEFDKLVLAKKRSDDLAALELEAMRLFDTAGPDAPANHLRARLMLHDENYHQAKAAIMQSINEFFHLMDKRTLATVRRAEDLALLFRMIFIAAALAASLILWRAYAVLRATLGGSADEVQAQMRRLGHGDYSAVMAVAPGMENSVLAGLAEIQNKLSGDEIRRKQSAAKLFDSESRLRAIIEHEPECIKIVDAQGRLIQMNPAGLAMIEADSLAQVAGQSMMSVIAPEYRVAFARLHQRVLGGEVMQMEFEVLGIKGGRRWLETHAVPMQDQGETVHLAVTRDITARKQAESDLRIAACAFESQEGMMITDARSVILRVNRAFTQITGYTAAEAIGQTPRLFQSGRHTGHFYTDMWDTIRRTGSWQGEIWDRRKNGEVYPKWLTITAVKDNDGMVTHYIGTHFDITERKNAEEKIRELAFFDQLTHLPNRTLLLDRLKQTMAASSRDGSYGALLFIDLDNFKMLNDTLGHDMGDLLLKQVAQRLTTCVREGDSVARIGGDEFVVMLASLGLSDRDAAASAEVIADKILAALNQTYQLGSVAYHSTPSIGVTLFKGQQVAMDDLMKQADLAMYRSKAAGRNAVRFFDPAMESAVMERAALEADLRRAVRESQFLLHYQAQVVGDGRVTGAEVLLRWQHPRRGMVSPAEFIPLAEETGLILPLGRWVLQTACAQLAVWATQPELAHLTVAVNVSAHQFREADFVEQVLAVLGTTGANPQRLKLELTESLLVSNVEDVIEKMFALKARGVDFSLDDFGTGYSSLSYLKRLPLNQLKIDQSFVRDVLSDPNDAAIAKTIIALAQSLGLGVIAEGVEMAAQRDFLAAAGCHAYQGYFFSRPLPREGFEAYARQL